MKKYDANARRRERYAKDPEYAERTRRNSAIWYKRYRDKNREHVQALWRARHAKRRECKMLEDKIEAACMRWVEQNGGRHRKLDRGHGAKGWVDQVVWMPNGVSFFVEFKVPGRKPTSKQKEKLDWFDLHGHRTFVIHSKEEWESLVVEWYKANS